MRKGYYFAIIIVVLSLIGSVAGCKQATPTTTVAKTTAAATTSSAVGKTTVSSTTSKPVTPKLLQWAVQDIGTGGYVTVGMVSESMRDKYGVTIRVLPVGNSVGRLTLPRSGSVQLAAVTGEKYQAREAVGDFAGRAWGPQQLRMIYYLPGSGPSSFAVRGNSGITALKDLRGQKVPWVVGLSSHNLMMEGALAYVGLTWNDVTKVELPSYAATADAILDGKTSVVVLNPQSPNAVRIAAAQGGIRWLGISPSDKEAWSRFMKFKPEIIPATLTKGTGVTGDNPVAGTSNAHTFDAYSTLDDDTAYFTTKAWVETYPLWKDKIPEDSGDIDVVLDIVGKVPYAWHPGSIRYFKEIGKWTAQHEAWNTKLLGREAGLLKAWDAFIAEADASKLTEDKLPAIWEKHRNSVPPVQ